VLYDVFNAKTISSDLFEIIGHSPSIGVRKLMRREKIFSAVYDNLRNCEANGIFYGSIGRVRLLIMHHSILEN